MPVSRQCGPNLSLPLLTRQAIAPQPETVPAQCGALCAGQCFDVVAVKGLQVGHQDAVPMPQNLETKRAGNDANPCGFKRWLCVHML